MYSQNVTALFITNLASHSLIIILLPSYQSCFYHLWTRLQLDFAPKYIPNIGTGAKPIAFGDLSYYWIMERRPLSVKTLRERYAIEGLVG